LPPEVFDEIQRTRIFEATCVAIADEGGYAKTSVADILDRAGMSNKTFYDYFDHKEDCVLAAYRHFAARLAAELKAAWSAAGSWADKLRAAVAAALSFGAANPLALRFLLLDAQTAGTVLLAEQHRSAEALVEALRDGSDGRGRASEMSPSLQQMLVVAIGWRIGWALHEEQPLDGLEGELVEFALMPYAGIG